MLVEQIEAEAAKLRKTLKYASWEDFAKPVETVPIPLKMSLTDAVFLIKNYPSENLGLALEVAGYRDLSIDMFKDLVEALSHLDDDGCEKLGAVLASNRTVPAGEIYREVLYTARFPRVFIALAQNPYIPHSVIVDLATITRNVEFLKVLFRTHGDILAIRDFVHPDLLTEYQSYVAKRVAEACIATAPEDFEGFVLNEEQEPVKQELARNPHTPSPLIEELSRGNTMSAHFALLRIVKDRKLSK